VAGYGVLALQTSNPPAPAKLPVRPAAKGAAGPIDGTWAVSAEKQDFVGYRVREKLGPLPAPDDAVGRTRIVRGRIVVSGSAITSGRTADVSSLKSDAEPRDGTLHQQGLESDRFPNAIFVLTKPLELGSPQRGRVLRLQAAGRLTLHGLTRAVPIALSARWNGDSIDVAGHTMIRLVDFR